MTQTRRLDFTVALIAPTDATVYRVRDYVRKAVSLWGLEFPNDEKSVFVSGVNVSRKGKEHSREPLGADTIDLSALIRRLQLIESQIRVAGRIPADMPIKVPVKVCEGFGVNRYGVTHVTAKPGFGVLLHYDRDD